MTPDCIVSIIVVKYLATVVLLIIAACTVIGVCIYLSMVYYVYPFK